MGIRYIETGDIFTSGAQVLVCPTNAIGVMGTGLAKAFRLRVPRLFYRYRLHCKSHDPQDMVPFAFMTSTFTVYCLHTKVKWWLNSSEAIIRDGLIKLIDWCQDNAVCTLALPALGCGRGGLDFITQVKPIIEELLKESDMDIIVYCS